MWPSSCISCSFYNIDDDGIHLVLVFLVVILAVAVAEEAEPYQLPQRCSDKCGGFQVPYPFFVNSSAKCGPPPSEAFRLSCNSSNGGGGESSVFLNIGSRSYRVLRFFPDGLLVDFPNSSTTCRRYNDLNSFRFAGNEYFGISTDNVIDLYDCEDSSICKGDCDERLMPPPACDGGSGGGYPACCLPLSDLGGNWTGFSMFAEFGCRGFSSWVVSPARSESKRGIKLEWGIPSNSSKHICAADAKIITASSVVSGIRCKCEDGFAGDGFSSGAGCLKSCFKEGKEVYGQDCKAKCHRTRKAKILVGIVASTLAIASLSALFCLLRRPIKEDTEEIIIHSSKSHNNIFSFQEACRSQVFSYSDLEEATGGFPDHQILCQAAKGRVYAGTLADGSQIAVHKIQCDGEREVVQMLSRAEAVSAVLHKNLARPLGWSISSAYTLLVVYDYSAANGTLKEHLSREKMGSLDWFQRLVIVAETASAVAFLQCEISPPIFHQNLQSGYIFLDQDWSAKVSGFELLDKDQKRMQDSDVYDIGLLLLEIIMGGADEQQQHEHAKLVLQKIRNGKVEEIVDSRLNYHGQTPSRREQIEIVADLATRCILFSGDGRIHMADVARELLHLTNYKATHRIRRGHSSSALEETFSNSSLLQMISMSPDSIYIPPAATRGFS